MTGSVWKKKQESLVKTGVLAALKKLILKFDSRLPDTSSLSLPSASTLSENEVNKIINDLFCDRSAAL